MGDFRDPSVVESWHASQLSHPARGEQLDILLALVERAAPRRALDVGVGSGLVTERVLEELPGTTIVGVDYSTAMLDRARARLDRFGSRVELVRGDLGKPEEIVLPPGTYNLAFSVQTLHNVEPEGQQRALGWLASMLAPGGIAFLLDKLALPQWLYHCYPLLADLPADYDAYAAAEDANGEHGTPLETQLEWLRAAGLEPAVLDLRANYALIAAGK